MIKSILCLTDFSPAAHNGLEYAANLSRLLSARITLMHVRPTIWPEAAQLEQERERSSEELTALLQSSADIVHQHFGIRCKIQLESTTETLEQVVESVSKNFDLVVTGTNGADDYYQFVFGSNSYRIVEGASCPVLAIPFGCRFKHPKQIVYAYDPQTNPIFLIDTLMTLANMLRSSVCVYYVVAGGRSPATEQLLEIVKGAVLARSHKDVKWEFDADFSNDVAWSIAQYVNRKTTDILALSYHHRSLAEVIFRKDTIKQTMMTIDCPVLVFRH